VRERGEGEESNSSLITLRIHTWDNHSSVHAFTALALSLFFSSRMHGEIKFLFLNITAVTDSSEVNPHQKSTCNSTSRRTFCAKKE
jgi:uncharacterized membrane protein (UPF0127 family)